MHDSSHAVWVAASDKELMELIQAGDERAFAELVKRYQNRLMNFVGRIVTERETAEELIQETFLRVFNRRHRYVPRYAVSTWIYTIALNLSRSELRKRKLRKIMSLDFAKEELNFEPAGQNDIRSENLAPFLEKQVARLPDDYRTAFILCDIQRLPYQQIAEILRIPAGTVKSRINRARVMLRESLKPYKEICHELSRGIPQIIGLY